MLIEQRGTDYISVNQDSTMDWDALRGKVAEQGMRNSNVMAIAPTATIANITGVSQSIEPTYQNLYVKSNLSGEFTVVNPHLVRDLKERGLWDKVMVNDLKYYDGSVQAIDRIPADLKAKYATAFEVEPRWLVDAASRRQKWIDQARLGFHKGLGKGTKDPGFETMILRSKDHEERIKDPSYEALIHTVRILKGLRKRYQGSWLNSLNSTQSGSRKGYQGS